MLELRHCACEEKWKTFLEVNVNFLTKDQGEEENYFGALKTKMFSDGFLKV